jgi:hypothetical protein
MTQDLLPWNHRLKRGNILSKTKGNFTAMVLRDKQDVYILTNMHHPQQIVTSVTNMEMLQSQKSYRTTINIWAMLTEGTGQ